MKTKEELNALKIEVESLNEKLAELTDEELDSVFGGQNGRSMMQVVPEGNVAPTTKVLRTLKEKTINGVNDTTTAVDRESIQKEIDDIMQQLNDNILVTYNHKSPLNG